MRAKSIFRAIALIAFVSSLQLSVSSQTFLWEAFDGGQMPPAGWTIDGLTNQWSIGNSNNAGGTAPEAKFTYVNSTSVTRLITPPMDLTGLTSVRMSFKHFYDDYTGAGPLAGVATRSGGGAWHSVWEINPTGNVGPEQIDLTINNADVGQPDFQVCFYLNGNMYNVDYWYIDNVLIFNPLNLDASLIGLNGTPSHFGAPAPVKGSVMNMGLTPLNSLEIMWKLDDGTVHSSIFTGLSVNLQQTYNFTCTDLMDAPIGEHLLEVWIHQVNNQTDDSQENDTLQKSVSRVSHTVDKRPLFEEFTSSTCGPCATFNVGFVPWCEQHEDDITLVKYQMNWPGSGDPYYTAEGGVRKDYYGVSFVPDLFCDGENIATNMSAVQQSYDAASAKPGLMAMVASHTLNGKMITVNGAVLPFANFQNCRLHIVVMEKVTHNNARTNGETSFHHVMMKMIPNGSGSTVNFTDRQVHTFNHTVDLTATNVEEWDDLIVGIFVQNFSTREVYQSVYSVENGSFNTEAHLSDLMVDGTTIAGFAQDVFEYDIVLPVGTTLVPVVTGLPVDPKAIVIVEPAYVLPGTTTIDVFAEDLTTHNLYTVNFFMSGIGIGEKPGQAVTAYPNPARETLTILGAANARVSLINAGGQTIRTIEEFKATTFSLKGIQAGVYSLRIELSGGGVVQKKIVVL